VQDNVGRRFGSRSVILLYHFIHPGGTTLADLMSHKKAAGDSGGFSGSIVEIEAS
jgi:hypothetical protein